jgi:hypothetical protein
MARPEAVEIAKAFVAELFGMPYQEPWERG